MLVDPGTEPPEGTVPGDTDRRFRQLLRRLFVENKLYSAEDDVFADQRATVRAPVRRLFTTFGRRYWRPFSMGLGAGIFARVLDLLPPLLLAIAIDAVFSRTGRSSWPGCRPPGSRTTGSVSSGSRSA